MTTRFGRRLVLAGLLVFLAAPWSTAQITSPGNWADRAASEYETISNVPYRTASNKELELNLDLYLPPRSAPVPAVIVARSDRPQLDRRARLPREVRTEALG